MAVVPFTPKGGATPPPPGDDLEERVKSLENGMTDIKVTLAEMKVTLSHLATKADVEAVRGEVREVKGALDGKLGLWQFVTLGLTMGGLTVAAISLLIKWPAISAALSVSGG